MDVFISWAGNRSLAAAEALKDWIPMLINAAKPWLSKAHIPSGRLWRTELAESLSTCKFGIFCLTPTSLQSHWMFFEAGAISKTLADTYVCPVLIDLKPSEVKSPFADFQCRIANKEGLLALMETLNAALPEGTAVSDSQLRTVFELLWPQLENKLAALPPDEKPVKTEREPNEVLEEILSRVRAIEQENAARIDSPANALQKPLSWLNQGRVLNKRLRQAFPDLDFKLEQAGQELTLEYPTKGRSARSRIRVEIGEVDSDTIYGAFADLLSDSAALKREERPSEPELTNRLDL